MPHPRSKAQQMCFLSRGSHHTRFWRNSAPDPANTSPDDCGCSVTQPCPTLCNPMHCSMPGFPILHYLLEFAQTHVLRVGNPIIIKEQYFIGTWNVRSMNQGKLKVVIEMARINIDILGNSELKCTGMGEFNSDDHYIYYCGQESLRGNGVAILVNKRVQNAVFGCNLKNNIMICVRLKANHSVSQ